MGPKDNQHVWFTDLIFTDVGLLVVPYGQLVRPTAATSKAASVAASLVVGGIGGFLDASKVNAAILPTYERQSKDAIASTPLALYAEREAATFFPADELAEFSVGERDFVVSFRGSLYSFSRTEGGERWGSSNPEPFIAEREWSRTVHRLELWREAAAADRRRRTGGPPVPGPAFLVEWASRPAGPLPAWVASAILEFARRCAAGDLRGASPGELKNLAQRLAHLGTGEGGEAARLVKTLMRCDAYGGAAASLGVAGFVAVLCTFAPLRGAPSGHGPAGALLLAAVGLGASALLCGGKWLKIRLMYGGARQEKIGTLPPDRGLSGGGQVM